MWETPYYIVVGQCQASVHFNVAHYYALVDACVAQSASSLAPHAVVYICVLHTRVVSMVG